jgi:hypothetical protein
MKQKAVLMFILTLVLSLILVPVVNGSAECQELIYDEGPDEGFHYSGNIDYQMGVRFSLPENWDNAKLKIARFWIVFNPVPFEVHVYDTEDNDLIQPFTVYPGSIGLFDVPIGIIVYGDFYVVIEWLEEAYPHIGANPFLPASGRTVYRVSSSNPWNVENGNIVIRAIVCEIPIGGEVLPNNVSIIGSWIIAGISTVAMSTGIVLKKKNRANTSRAHHRGGSKHSTQAI